MRIELHQRRTASQCIQAGTSKRSGKRSEADICTECNEAPVVLGEDLCILCLREKKRQETLEKICDDTSDDEDAEDELIKPKLEDDDEPEKELPDGFTEIVDEDLDADDDEDFEEEPFTDEESMRATACPYGRRRRKSVSMEENRG